MRIRYPILMCLGILATAQAQAFDFFETMSIRGGIAVGQLDLGNDNFGGISGVLRFDGHSTGWSPYTGFEFNRYLAAEIGYLEGGSPTSDVVVTDTLTFLRLESDTIKNSAFHVSAIGSLPVNSAVSFFGRLGFMHWKSSTRATQTDVTFNSTGQTVTSVTVANARASNTGNDPYYGVGVALNVDKGLLRLEYDLSKINGADARYISLSVAWKFRPW